MALVVTRKKFTEMQKEDGALTQKLLMTLIVQNESNRPGRVRPLARNRAGLVGDLDLDRSIRDAIGNAGMALRLLKGKDYEISLTQAQKESFEQIFKLILEPGEEEIPMELFSSYVSREAKALGSQIGHKQFMNMIDDSGIDEDGDGVLTLDEFLSFLRGLFLADIPSVEVALLRKAYDAAVAEAPDMPMEESRVQVLFASLGFDVESSGWQDVMGVIDADGDGDVDFSEFLTGIGMMKQFCLLSSQLDAAFRDFKIESTKMRRASLALSRSLAATQSESNPGVFGSSNSLKALAASFQAVAGTEFQARFTVPQDDEDDLNEDSPDLDAGDLEAFLTITRDEAEEMVFLADQDEVDAVQNEQGSQNDEAVISYRTIDTDEFQQLIRSWA